jgi:hypothetical protein
VTLGGQLNDVSLFRRLRLPLMVVAVAALAILVYRARVHREMVDFAVFHTAATRALDAAPLYRESDGHFQFKYFPGFAVALAPLGLMDQSIAKFAWFSASLALLVAFLRWSVTALPDRRRSERVLVLLTLLLMAKFYTRELLLGQTNLMLGALLVGAVVAALRGHSIAAGVLTGLGVFVKPYALILIPWLLAAQGTSAFAAALLVVAAGLLAPAMVYGWQGNVDLLAAWWQTVSESTTPNLLNNDNISIAAMWAKWLGAGTVASLLALLTVVAVFAAALTAWLWRRRPARRPEYLECALLMLLIPLVSPQGWDYVLLLATPAVVCLIDRWAELTRGWRWTVAAALAVTGLTMFDVMGRALYGRFMALSVISVCALTLAAGLLVVRGRGLA